MFKYSRFIVFLKKRIILLYLKALGKEDNTYNKARIITLLRGLLFSSGYYVIALIFYLLDIEKDLFASTFPFITLTITGIFLCITGKWKSCTHLLLIFITLQNLSSIFFGDYSKDILFVQQVILSMLISNFLLGVRKGSIYSILNIVIAFIYFSKTRHTPTNEISLSTIFTFTYSLLFIMLYIWSFLDVVKGVLIKNESDNIKKKKLFEELQTSVNTAKRLAKSKTEFLSNMTHELRTPLNSVIGFSHLLLHENPTNTQKENLNALLFSAENLLAIINNILDFNKLDVNKIELEKFDFNISILLDKIYIDAQLKANKKNIGLLIQYSPGLKNLTISGDSTRLTQILYNLIDNGIKFTEIGHVKLEVLILKKTDELVTLKFNISDTGIGIHPEALSRIFKPFEQAEAQTTRKYGGTGLGLSIVNKIIELHHSKLNCESYLGNGTRFYFEIQYPISKLTTLHPIRKLEKGEHKDLHRLKILLVEDNAMNILLMGKLFYNWKINYKLAKDGKMGVELALSQDFDVVFMDINMPIMDGIEASTIIKNQKPNICIVALTANTTNYEERLEYKHLFDHYISKPIIQDKLLILLENKNKLYYGSESQNKIE